MDFTEEEFSQLEMLVRRLERNRHWIGDGTTIGNACMTFRNALESNRVEICSAITKAAFDAAEDAADSRPKWTSAGCCRSKWKA